MANYQFKSTTTMKDYNCQKWWIDGKIIPEMIIQADNVKAAISQFAEKSAEYCGITISANAIRTKSPMFIDTVDGKSKQVGYVITGKTEMYDDSKCKFSEQYVDIWVNIAEICDVDFEEEIA